MAVKMGKDNPGQANVVQLDSIVGAGPRMRSVHMAIDLLRPSEALLERSKLVKVDQLICIPYTFLCICSDLLYIHIPYEFIYIYIYQGSLSRVRKAGAIGSKNCRA